VRKAILSLSALTFLALLLRAADAPAEPARAAFERGNASLRDAQQACDHHKTELLHQAAGQYRDCLDCPVSTPEAGAFSTVARHNLELTRLLLAQATPPEKSGGDKDKEPGPGDSPKDKDGHQGGPTDQQAPPEPKGDSGNADQANPKNDSSTGAPAPKEKEGWNDQPKSGASAQAEKHQPESQCPT